MLNNRSVPADVLLSHVVYQNLLVAIEWLTRVFGFTEHFRYGQPVSGAQMLFGSACLMVHQSAKGQSSPAQLGYGTQSLTVFVQDVDAQICQSEVTGWPHCRGTP